MIRLMNYIGSKHSLLAFLESSILKVAGSQNKKFCDLFAGTGATGLHFKKLGFEITSNDLQYYSYVLNRHYIMNHKQLEFIGLIDELELLKEVQIDERKQVVCSYLNELRGVEGFIFREYCPSAQSKRQYFTVDNGKKCDAMRLKIEEWKTQGKINDDEYYFLVASLLESLDKVANTASVYGAYLKKFKKTALAPLEIKPAPLYLNSKSHFVYNKNANDLILDINTDILYLDPPYNQRQYATNYHVLETIAKYDNPKLYGKTGLRDYANQKSKYCSSLAVKDEFAHLISNAKAKYIFLSYNNEGLLSLDEIKQIMQAKGEYGFFAQEYSRFKADSSREYSAKATTEYLHYCVVGGQE